MSSIEGFLITLNENKDLEACKTLKCRNKREVRENAARTRMTLQRPATSSDRSIP